MLKAFLSYPYQQEIEKYVEEIKPFIEENGVEIIDGKLPDATQSLSAEILKLIKQSDFLICIYSDKHPSRWADHEVGIAKGAGKDTIIITDKKDKQSGFFDNQYHISRDQGGIKVCTDLKHAIDGIKKRIGKSPETIISREAPESEIEEEKWPKEVVDHIFNMRKKFDELDYHGIIDEAENAVKEHPECWRYNIAKSSALTHIGKYEEAKKELSELINKFKKENRPLSYAYTNLGWVENQQSTNANKNLEKEIKYYKKSLAYENRESTYINIIMSLIEAKKNDETEQYLGGFIRRFPHFIPALESRLKIYNLDDNVQIPDTVRNILNIEDI